MQQLLLRIDKNVIYCKFRDRNIIKKMSVIKFNLKNNLIQKYNKI